MVKCDAYGMDLDRIKRFHSSITVSPALPTAIASSFAGGDRAQTMRSVEFRGSKCPGRLSVRDSPGERGALPVGGYERFRKLDLPIDAN